MNGKCDHRWNKRIKVEKDGITYKCMVCREVYKLPGKVTQTGDERMLLGPRDNGIGSTF